MGMPRTPKKISRQELIPFEGTKSPCRTEILGRRGTNGRPQVSKERIEEMGQMFFGGPCLSI